MFKFKPKHKAFEYKPRFYNQQKEELMERVARYNKEGKQENVEVTKDNIRASFRSGTGTQADLGYRASMVNKSNKRLLVVIVILCVVLYMMMQSDHVIKLMESM